MSIENVETIVLTKINKRQKCSHYYVSCAMSNCNKKATHWLTRSNKYYCQTDLICTSHARIWLTVKKLLGDSSGVSI